ncbi:hypothetical protein D3C81_1895680 [compost metagenome]
MIDIFLSPRREQVAKPAGKGEQAKVDQRGSNRAGQPYQQVTRSSMGQPTRGFCIELHDCRHLPRFVDERDVMLDKQVAWLSHELLFFAIFFDLAVACNDATLARLSVLQFVVVRELLADQF